MLRVRNVTLLLIALVCYGESASARYVQSDPIGLEGGVNTYTYVGANPLSSIDPLGLATLVITSGWNGGTNVFGHSALAFTGQGVYSYGTKELYGSSLTDYLTSQLSDRSVTVTILNTTPEQEQKMMEHYKTNYGKDAQYHAQSNNCSNAAAVALSDAGVIKAPFITDGMTPFDVQRWTSNLPGAEVQNLIRGTSALGSFQVYNHK